MNYWPLTACFLCNKVESVEIESVEKMGIKRTLLWVTGILIIVALMLYLGWEDIRQVILRADPRVLATLCALQVVTLATSAYQWHYLLKKNYPALPFTQVFKVNLAGSFVESITPSVKLGGEAAKVYLLRKQAPLSYEEITGALLVHKYVSLFPFVLICVFILALAALFYQLPAVAYLSFLLLLSVFGLFYRMVNKKSPGKQGQEEKEEEDEQEEGAAGIPRVLKPAKKAYRFLQKASGHAGNLTSTKDRHFLFFLSLLVWGCYPVKILLVAVMLNFNVGILTAAITTYTAYLVSMVPLFPGGLGSFEGSMAFMFSLGGLTAVEGLGIAILSRSITYWFPLLLAAGAALMLSTERKNTKNALDATIYPERK